MIGVLFLGNFDMLVPIVVVFWRRVDQGWSRRKDWVPEKLFEGKCPW
jgi:hypothetical protein